MYPFVMAGRPACKCMARIVPFIWTCAVCADRWIGGTVPLAQRYVGARQGATGYWSLPSICSPWQERVGQGPL